MGTEEQGAGSGEPAADRALRERCGVARKALARWERRLGNALRRLEPPEGQLEEAGRIEALTQSLLAHRDRVRPGARSVRVVDYGDPDLAEVEVPLDPALGLAELVAARFARAARLRRTAAAHARRVADLEAERGEVRGWGERLGALEEALRPQVREDGAVAWIPRKARREAERALDALEARLVPRGLWPQPPRRREEPRKDGPLRWDLEGGWILWAGRSGLENDLLTGKFALADDLWFHAAHVPGSHVLLRSPGGKASPVPPALLERAAATAAWLSKLRNQERAEVHWTRRKHVRKPRKAPAGTVLMEHFQVATVRPQAPPSSP